MISDIFSILLAIPTVTFVNSSLIALKGQSLSIHYTIEQGNPPSYSIQLLHDTIPLNLTSNRYTLFPHSNITINTIQFSDSGVYSLVISSEAGHNSVSLDVTVDGK